MRFFQFVFVALCFLLCTSRLSGATYYWVGGTGTWNQFNTHWATTSGGMVFHSQAPTANDDVVFDVNSFTGTNQTVTLDNGTFLCRSMTWSGTLYNPRIYTNTAFNSFLFIYGSLYTTTGMSWQYSGFVRFAATTSGHTITAPPVSIGRVTFLGNGGVWTLLDTFYTQELELDRGTLRTNNYPINSSYSITATSTNTKALYLGTSRLAAQYLTFTSSALTLDADSSRLYCAELQGGSGRVFNRVDFGTPFSSHVLIITACSVKYVGSGTGGSFVLTGGNNNVIDTLIVRRSATIYYITSFGYLEVSDNVTCHSAQTFGKLYCNNPGKTVMLKSGVTTTITNTIISNNSCSFGAITFRSTASGTQATISKASGTITCYNLSLQDINATGGASFVASNSSIVSNVTGWTVNGAGSLNLFWVGGSGSWSDNSHWSTTSGGAGGSCIPTAIDNVIFDANSFSAAGQQVFVNVAASCNDMTWINVQYQPTLYNTNPAGMINVYGNYSLCTGMNWNFLGTIRLAATTPNKIINTSGISLVSSNLSCDASGGYWTLLDSIRCKYLVVNRGTFNSNNKVIRVTNTVDMTASNPKTVLLGKSLVDCNRWDAPVGNLTLDADSCTISCEVFASGSNYIYNNATMALHLSYPTGYCAIMASTCVFDTVVFLDPGGIQYDDGSYNSVLFMEDGDVNGNWCHFDKLECRGNLNVQGVMINYDTLYLNNPGFVSEFIGGQTQFINNAIIANGSCVAGNITIRSSTNGMQATFSKPNGTVTCSYIVLQDINGTGGANFIANFSTNGGNVTGWTINSGGSRILHWVGGTGNWSDLNHWSLVSGGSGGQCAPTPDDDVIFDANSFTGNNTVMIDGAVASCRNMTWTTMSSTPMVVNTFPPVPNQPGDLKIYGSLLLNNQVDWDYDGNIIFTGALRGNTINMLGDTAVSIFFDGQGAEWILNGTLNTMNLRLDNGTLKTNNHSVFCSDICELYGDSAHLGTSVVSTQYWINYLDSGAFDAGSSIVSAVWFESYGQTYNNIDMAAYPYPVTFYSVNCNYNTVEFSTIVVEFYNCENNNFENAIFYGDATVRGVEQFERAEFIGNVIFEDSVSFDTLYLNNPGQAVLLRENTTYVINEALLTNSQSGNPISISSMVSGVQATISKVADTVCVDNLSLQDINATGGAVFFAGLNTTNISNNSGWIFSSCTIPYVDVWPGDVNADLVVDNLDAIYLGIAYGTSSYTRAGANISWSAQPCQEWPFVYTNLVNVNNADCDGNGTVDTLDVGAIVANYGMTRPPIAPPQSMRMEQALTAGIPLFFQPASLYYAPGDTVSIPVYLGTSGTPVTSGYGLATSIVYDPTRIVTGTTDLLLGNSWFTPQGNRLELIYDNASNSMIEFTDTRKNGQNISGNGQIGIFTFILDANAADSVQLSFTDSKLLDVDQNDIPISEQPITIYIQAPPVANFVAGTPTVCAGGSVNFTDQSTSLPTSWLWSFPGGSPSSSTNQNPTITYNTPGAYDVTLTVTNAAGSDVQTLTGYVVVNALPNVAFTSTPSTQSVCAGQNVTLSGTGAATYSWSGGVVDGNTFAPSATSTYTVTGTDGNGCTATAQATITVDPVPTLTITTTPSNGIVCTGTQATLIASGAQNYSWTGGVTNGVPFVPSATTTYTVTGTDVSGCSSTAQTTLTVLACAYQTQLNSTWCGATNCLISQTIVANGVTGATNFEFKFTNAALNYSQSRTKGNSIPSMPLTWIAGLQYGFTYDVQVRAFVGGVWQAYGPVCTLSTAPQIPSTQLVNCAATNMTLSNSISVVPVAGAINYEYEVTNAQQPYTVVRQMGSNTSSIPLSWFAGLQYGRTYNVRVKSKVGNVWSSYGGTCTFAMQSTNPATQLTSPYCGAVGLTAASPITYSSVVGATNYMVNITNTALGYDQTRVRGNSLTTIYLSSFSGLQNNTTYTVTVTSYVGSQWGTFGPPCTITLGTVARYVKPEMETPTIGFATLLYPNPVGDNVTPMLNISGADGQEANVNIVDINGRVLFTYLFFVEGDVFTTTLYGFPDLVAGIYIMQVQVGDKVQNTKFIAE